MTLSVAMITRNAERTLARALTALRGLADEIVVVDSGSTDQTKDIALDFGARFIEHSWMGFGAQKNLAIAECSGDWILVLDADEILDLSLILEIKKATAQPAGHGLSPTVSTAKMPVYLVTRRVCAFGQNLNLEDAVARLFPRGMARLDERPVHEMLTFDQDQCELKALSGFLWHETYLDLASYFEKFDRYTSLGAEGLVARGRSFSPFETVARSVFRFLRLYFGKNLVTKGWIGFQYSVLGALYVFVKYAKVRERVNP